MGHYKAKREKGIQTKGVSNYNFKGVNNYDYVLRNFKVKAFIWDDDEELIDDEENKPDYIKIVKKQIKEAKAKKREAEAKKKEEENDIVFDFENDDLEPEEDEEKNLNEGGSQAEIGVKENNKEETPTPTPENDSKEENLNEKGSQAEIEVNENNKEETPTLTPENDLKEENLNEKGSQTEIEVNENNKGETPTPENREKKIVNPDEEIKVLHVANDRELDIRGNDGDQSNIEECPESINKPPVFEAYVKVSAMNNSDNGHSFLGFRFTSKEKGADGRIVYQRKHICVGYAPDGGMLLQILALTPAVMLRDTTHSATIGYQKEISYDKLQLLTRNIPEYFNQYPKYSLLKNNCNRFVRCMAKGIGLPDIHSMYSHLNVFNAPKRSLKNMTKKFYEELKNDEDSGSSNFMFNWASNQVKGDGDPDLSNFVFNWAPNNEKKYTTGMGGFRNVRDLDISREKFFDKAFVGSEKDMSYFTKFLVMPGLDGNLDRATKLSDDDKSKKTLLKESRLNRLQRLFGSDEILDEMSELLHLLKSDEEDEDSNKNYGTTADLKVLLDKVPGAIDFYDIDLQQDGDLEKKKAQRDKRYRRIISHLRNIVKLSGKKHKQFVYFCMQTIDRYKILLDLESASESSKTFNINETEHK